MQASNQDIQDIVIEIVLFDNNFSPNGEQPERSGLAHTLWQPISGCIAIFNKCCCFTKHGVLKQIWLYKILGSMLLICQNITMSVYGAWIKRCCVLCSKTYVTFGGLSWSPAGFWQATRNTRICETCLLTWSERDQIGFDSIDNRGSVQAFSSFFSYLAWSSPMIQNFVTVEAKV